MERLQSATAYFIILGTCVAGIVRAPWWAALVGGCLMLLISLTWHREAYARYAETQDTTAQSVQLFAGVLNASAAAAAAYAMGRAIGWIWGV